MVTRTDNQLKNVFYGNDIATKVLSYLDPVEKPRDLQALFHGLIYKGCDHLSLKEALIRSSHQVDTLIKDELEKETKVLSALLPPPFQEEANTILQVPNLPIQILRRLLTENLLSHALRLRDKETILLLMNHCMPEHRNSLAFVYKIREAGSNASALLGLFSNRSLTDYPSPQSAAFYAYEGNRWDEYIALLKVARKLNPQQPLPPQTVSMPSNMVQAFNENNLPVIKALLETMQEGNLWYVTLDILILLRCYELVLDVMKTRKLSVNVESIYAFSAHIEKTINAAMEQGHLDCLKKLFKESWWEDSRSLAVSWAATAAEYGQIDFLSYLFDPCFHTKEEIEGYQQNAIEELYFHEVDATLESKEKTATWVLRQLDPDRQKPLALHGIRCLFGELTGGDWDDDPSTHEGVFIERMINLTLNEVKSLTRQEVEAIREASLEE